MNIRPMQAGDFSAFWPVFQAIIQAQESYAFDPQLSEAQARALWCELPQETWLAEEDGVLLGSYFIKPNAAGPGGHVCNCGYMVAPAARGKGVASALCAHSQQRARAGVSGHAVQCGGGQQYRGGSLVEKLGFAEVGRVPGAYRHRSLGLVDCLIMHKWLQAPEADKPLTASAPLIARKNIEAVVSRKRKRTDGSVMRRYFVAQRAAAVAAIGLGGLELLVHQAQLLLQQVDLLLLAGNGAVEAVEQVVLKAIFTSSSVRRSSVFMRAFYLGRHMAGYWMMSLLWNKNSSFYCFRN
jgi:GNAT superfamily N-acetyltransferase